MKFNFNNVKMGDKVLLEDGFEGIVIAMRSYAFMNDEIIRTAETMEQHVLIDLAPFEFDNVRHQKVDYYTLTLAIKSEGRGYFLYETDFPEIKEIIREHKQEKFKCLINKIKKFLNEEIKRRFK